ncbi:MAG: SDR family oxidoreductase [Candidatus Omnitrophica bacterium]|nr:SDR family oxidoreductase [Candidatus Omnitrophota bacterium]
MKNKLFLVTGATGTIGSEVVKQLVQDGHRVRALVRDLAKAQKLGKSVEAVKGDLSKPETLGAAFVGVDKAFVLSIGPELAKLEANAFDAAKRANVKHVVKLSGGIEGGIESDYFMAGTALLQWHRESEKRLRALGVAWTILRPGSFASNVLQWQVKEQGALFLPAGDGKDTITDPRDIAAVAVKVLTTLGHEGKIYELTGPELLSYADVVQKMATAVGKPLKYVDVPEAKAREGMLAAGVPPLLADSMLCYFAWVKAGRMFTTSTVAELLGRPARSFDEWAKDHVAALR